MGRAHGNAWGQVASSSTCPLPPVWSRSARVTRRRWPLCAHAGAGSATPPTGGSSAPTPSIQLVDVATPNHVHAEPAIAMLEAGKHVACEKPLAGTLADARAMKEAARNEPRAKTFVWFNYRRCPAVGLAWALVAGRRAGHASTTCAPATCRAGAGKETPLLWRFQKVPGRLGRAWRPERPHHRPGAIPLGRGDHHGARRRVRDVRHPSARFPAPPKTGRSTVDDAVLFLATLSGGAVASFECSRVATGHLNDNTVELNGERGACGFPSRT